MRTLGETLEHFSDRAYQELGIESAIKTAQIKCEVVKASKRGAPDTEDTVEPMKDIEQASRGGFFCGNAASGHRMIMAIVHIDYHLRYAYIMVWLLIATLLFALADNSYYAGDYLGIEKYDTSTSCETLYLTTAC